MYIVCIYISTHVYERFSDPFAVPLCECFLLRNSCAKDVYDILQGQFGIDICWPHIHNAVCAHRTVSKVTICCWIGAIVESLDIAVAKGHPCTLQYPQELRLADPERSRAMLQSKINTESVASPKTVAAVWFCKT